jgi:hypothetical protein
MGNIADTQWLIHVLSNHRMYFTYSCFFCFYEPSFKYIREAPISGRHAEAYLVEALCYKVEGCRFTSRMRSLLFSNLQNLSNCTMALGWTQPLTEMSTKNLPGGKAQPAHEADNLTAIC